MPGRRTPGQAALARAYDRARAVAARLDRAGPGAGDEVRRMAAAAIEEAVDVALGRIGRIGSDTRPSGVYARGRDAHARARSNE